MMETGITWDRARADQVAEIAKAVLDFQGKVCVESLIMDMKRNASSTVKGEKINPKATNPYVRGTNDKAQSESKQEENGFENVKAPLPKRFSPK